MNKLVSLVNVFALLSLLAVGGGTAVLPQMKHETVATHRWLSAEQFTDIYGLGQLAPGPNMNMVDVIGYRVAGIPGAFLALLAFYLPARQSRSEKQTRRCTRTRRRTSSRFVPCGSLLSRDG